MKIDPDLGSRLKQEVEIYDPFALRSAASGLVGYSREELCWKRDVKNSKTRSAQVNLFTDSGRCSARVQVVSTLSDNQEPQIIYESCFSANRQGYWECLDSLGQSLARILHENGFGKHNTNIVNGLAYLQNGQQINLGLLEECTRSCLSVHLSNHLAELERLAARARQ
jgi:hypothetical protein